MKEAEKLHAMLDAAFERGREAERRDVVAYLRRTAGESPNYQVCGLSEAHRVEAGRHIVQRAAAGLTNRAFFEALKKDT